MKRSAADIYSGEDPIVVKPPVYQEEVVYLDGLQWDVQDQIDQVRSGLIHSERSYPPKGISSNPETIMNQAYGNGEYVFEASNTDASSDVIHLFDKIKSSSYITEMDPGKYDETTGVYIGDTQAFSGSPLGEYVKMTFPIPIEPTRYKLNMYDANSTPKEVYFYGKHSCGCDDWVLLHTGEPVADEDYLSPDLGVSGLFDNFLLIVESTYLKKYMRVKGMLVYGKEIIKTPDIQEKIDMLSDALQNAELAYPPSAISSNPQTITGELYGNGEYSFEVSSGIHTGSDVINAFDENPATFLNYDASPEVYDGTGAYVGSEQAFTGAPLGEYFKMILPFALEPTKYSLTPEQISTAPSLIYLYGKRINTGDVWEHLNTMSNDAASPFESDEFNITGYFTEFILIIGSVVSTTVCEIREFKIYGREFDMLKAIDISNKQDKVTGVSDTEIGYLSSVTSDIQTQLDTKIEMTDIESKQDKVTGVSDTEIGYLANVTSDIQSQIDAAAGGIDVSSKQDKISGFVTKTVILTKTIENTVDWYAKIMEIEADAGQCAGFMVDVDVTHGNPASGQNDSCARRYTFGWHHNTETNGEYFRLLPLTNSGPNVNGHDYRIVIQKISDLKVAVLFGNVTPDSLDLKIKTAFCFGVHYPPTTTDIIFTDKTGVADTEDFLDATIKNKPFWGDSLLTQREGCVGIQIERPTLGFEVNTTSKFYDDMTLEGNVTLGGNLNNVTTTQIGYMENVTSDIQTQIDGKADTSAVGTKQDKVTGVTDTEIGYLSNVTSDIQTQLDAKLDNGDPNVLMKVGTVGDTEIGYLQNLSGNVQTQIDAKATSVDISNKQDKVTGVSDTEIGYLQNVIHDLQGQLDVLTNIITGAECKYPPHDWSLDSETVVMSNSAGYGAGYYTSFESSRYNFNANYAAYKAFNSTLTEYWASLDNYHIQSGEYFGSSNINGSYGEWIGVQIPHTKGVYPTKFVLKIYPFFSLNYYRAKDIQIFGVVENGTPIPENRVILKKTDISEEEYVTDGDWETLTLNISTYPMRSLAYTRFFVVVNKIFGNPASSPSTASCAISKLEIWGRQSPFQKTEDSIKFVYPPNDLIT